MIKQLIFLLFLMLNARLYSQQYLIKYIYKPNTDNVAYNLSLKNNSSVFEINSYLISKELEDKEITENKCDKFKIERKGDKLFVKDNIENTRIVSMIPTEIIWNLENSAGKFLQYDTKLASTHYDSKKYFADYTSEIPINDGPFIFKFLPGLITKIKDENGEVIFQLQSVQKTAESIECNNHNFKILGFDRYVKIIHQKQKMENSLITSLKNLPGINIGNKKIDQIYFDPVKFLLK